MEKSVGFFFKNRAIQLFFYSAHNHTKAALCVNHNNSSDSTNEEDQSIKAQLDRSQL